MCVDIHRDIQGAGGQFAGDPRPRRALRARLGDSLRLTMRTRSWVEEGGRQGEPWASCRQLGLVDPSWSNQRVCLAPWIESGVPNSPSLHPSFGLILARLDIGSIENLVLWRCPGVDSLFVSWVLLASILDFNKPWFMLRWIDINGDFNCIFLF